MGRRAARVMRLAAAAAAGGGGSGGGGGYDIWLCPCWWCWCRKGLRLPVRCARDADALDVTCGGDLDCACLPDVSCTGTTRRACPTRCPFPVTEAEGGLELVEIIVLCHSSHQQHMCPASCWQGRRVARVRGLTFGGPQNALTSPNKLALGLAELL
jgi:hypothetical protein